MAQEWTTPDSSCPHEEDAISLPLGSDHNTLDESYISIPQAQSQHTVCAGACLDIYFFLHLCSHHCTLQMSERGI